MSSPNPQLDHLKSLVSQLQAKIEKLEQASAATASDLKDAAVDTAHAVQDKLGLKATPAQHLRMVLMGPPGAGEPFRFALGLATELEGSGAGWVGEEGRGSAGRVCGLRAEWQSVYRAVGVLALLLGGPA